MSFKLLLLPILVCTCIFVHAQKNKGTDEEIQTPISEEKGLIKISVMYPYGEGNTFDMEYYTQKHMPMVASYLGKNLVRYTIEKGLASGIPNAPLPYLAIGTFYIHDLGKYKEAIAPNIESIRADFPNYTNTVPVILVSEVVY